MGDRIRSEMENGAGLILPMGRFLRDFIPLSILMNKIQMVCRFLEIICSQNMISALNIFDVLFETNPKSQSQIEKGKRNLDSKLKSYF